MILKLSAFVSEWPTSDKPFVRSIVAPPTVAASVTADEFEVLIK